MQLAIQQKRLIDWQKQWRKALSLRVLWSVFVRGILKDSKRKSPKDINHRVPLMPRGQHLSCGQLVADIWKSLDTSLTIADVIRANRNAENDPLLVEQPCTGPLAMVTWRLSDICCLSPNQINHQYPFTSSWKPRRRTELLHLDGPVGNAIWK